jgi:hypothetical protein
MEKKKIYAHCRKCGKRIRIELDTKNVKFSGDQLHLIVHAHGELGEDAHAVIIEIDRNFNIRNTRISDKFFFTFDI